MKQKIFGRGKHLLKNMLKTQDILKFKLLLINMEMFYILGERDCSIQKTSKVIEIAPSPLLNNEKEKSYIELLQRLCLN